MRNFGWMDAVFVLFLLTPILALVHMILFTIIFVIVLGHSVGEMFPASFITGIVVFLFGMFALWRLSPGPGPMVEQPRLLVIAFVALMGLSLAVWIIGFEAKEDIFGVLLPLFYLFSLVGFAVFLTASINARAPPSRTSFVRGQRTPLEGIPLVNNLIQVPPSHVKAYAGLEKANGVPEAPPTSAIRRKM